MSKMGKFINLPYASRKLYQNFRRKCEIFLLNIEINMKLLKIFVGPLTNFDSVVKFLHNQEILRNYEQTFMEMSGL